MKECKYCGEIATTESHHIVSRKQQPALINCEFNKIDLCINCHKGTKGAHGKYPEEIQKRLKLQFQRNLYELFDKDQLTLDEIQETLKIRYKDAIKLVRMIYPKAGLYKKEDVIRACMGGKLVLEDE